ncbi:MAG TPA: glutamine-hydrolyzing carbamoyl-phosphate synthase small subunit [Methanomicrobiales archaeon]|nr:glutamine-hydrolyzing carbamoyl-phosphate synthase small subunit [Methanomicrobiales archaeon]
MKAVLGLEDGTYVVGSGFGVEGCCSGELVFTTQMTGYMEALTDPSYHGQILMFTYPLIGNYGVDVTNFQSGRVWARGCVVRELCEKPEHSPTMESYFEKQGLFGIRGVDTRMLTIRLREFGTMRAALIVGNDDGEAAIQMARKEPFITDIDLLPAVTCREPYRIPGSGKRVAVLDLGIKKNMLISLAKRNADIYVFPSHATYRDVSAVEPDALFISNGPGDPKRATAAIQCVRRFIGEIPIFGICMGNQVTALALGGDTYKLKFGHRGANQPVRYNDGRIFVTTQNHGFAVDTETLPEGCRTAYTNVNDGTNEGFEAGDLSIMCAQFHPEAHGGPRDTESHYFETMFRRIP